MANSYKCSFCNGDGARCDCHKKRSSSGFGIGFIGSGMAKAYNTIHGTSACDDTALDKILENEREIEHNLKKLRSLK